MAEHTVKAFTEELDGLTQEVARMGGLAETAINDSLAAVARRDTELAQAVIQRDPKIDAAQREIERRAIKLFALRQPMASDLRVVLTAELKGGADDYQDFYCATVEWEWGDETKSETAADCDPYEPGKSEIKRRYIQEHTFRSVSSDEPGAPAAPTQFRVKFSLKQKNKTVGSAQTVVEIRAGLPGQ